MPDISVITPCRNYGHFIQDALASVQAQRNVVVEHVVQDGASSDRTLDVLRSQPDSVRWSSVEDSGPSDALNKAFAEARSPWIAWLNADEFYLPQGLSILLEEAQRTRSHVVFGDCVFVDEAGKFQRLLPQHRFDARVLRWYGCYISSCCVLFRRDILGDKPWDVRFRRVMDWALYLRLVDEGVRFHHVSFPVGAFRVHPSRITAAPMSESVREYLYIQKRFSAGPLEGQKSRGAILHRGYKLTNGAYLRQLMARRYRGADWRWFRGGDRAEVVSQFRSRCYPGRRSAA